MNEIFYRAKSPKSYETSWSIRRVLEAWALCRGALLSEYNHDEFVIHPARYTFRPEDWNFHRHKIQNIFYKPHMSQLLLVFSYRDLSYLLMIIKMWRSVGVWTCFAWAKVSPNIECWTICLSTNRLSTQHFLWSQCYGNTILRDRWKES